MANTWLRTVREAIQQYLQYEATDFSEVSATGVCSSTNVLTVATQTFDASWIGRYVNIRDTANIDGKYKIATIVSGSGSHSITFTTAYPATLTVPVAARWGVFSKVGMAIRRAYWFTDRSTVPGNIVQSDMPALVLYGDGDHGAVQFTTGQVQCSYRLHCELYTGGEDQGRIEDLFCLVADRLYRGRQPTEAFGITQYDTGISSVEIDGFKFSFIKIVKTTPSAEVDTGYGWTCQFPIVVKIRRGVQSDA